jgi:hypothetical protein
MTKFLKLIGSRLMISHRHRTVRQSMIFLFTNILLLAGLIFLIEIALILLGVGDIFIPPTLQITKFLKSIFF